MISLFRDQVGGYIVKWLNARLAQGKTNGYRVIVGLVAVLDAGLEFLIQGKIASFPSLGTPTALGHIGRSRGILRGLADTNAQYAQRLLEWLDSWKHAGIAEQIVRRIYEYLPAHPRVMFVNRSGYWVVIDSGVVTKTTRPLSDWNWDTLSNPERSGFWSEFWLIVYPPTYTPNTDAYGDPGLTWTDDGYALGFSDAPLEQLRTIRNLVATWKSAHSMPRTIIFVNPLFPTDFDPDGAGTMPDGYYGQWSKIVAGVSVPARDLNHRYLEYEFP